MLILLSFILRSDIQLQITLEVLLHYFNMEFFDYTGKFMSGLMSWILWNELTYISLVLEKIDGDLIPFTHNFQLVMYICS